MKVIGYAPERKQDIIDLNVWRIEKYFGKVEQPDWDELDHVDEEVEKGGMAFFAVDDAGRALATCMAIKRGDDEWEIAKLGSDPDRPHKGCGTAVFEACVNWAEQHGARRHRVRHLHRGAVRHLQRRGQPRQGRPPRHG